MAVGVVAERGAQNQADPVGGNVVGQAAVQTQQIPRDGQAGQRDAEPDSAEEEEEQHLAAAVIAPAVRPGPPAVADVVDRDGGDDGQGAGGEWMAGS